MCIKYSVNKNNEIGNKAIIKDHKDHIYHPTMPIPIRHKEGIKSDDEILLKACQF